MQKAPEKIKFKYVFEDSYNPAYTTGAFGGPTPKNEIILNFYMERQPIPYSETHEINPDGTAGKVIESKPSKEDSIINVIRYVESGIVMDLNTAKEIHAWLGENIKAVEAMNIVQKGKTE